MEGPNASCFCDEYPIIGSGQTLGLTLFNANAIKHPISRGQTHDVEAVQRIFLREAG